MVTRTARKELWLVDNDRMAWKCTYDPEKVKVITSPTAAVILGGLKMKPMLVPEPPTSTFYIYCQ